MSKSAIILGSTGSIGKQALEILDQYKEEFRLIGISAGHDSPALRKQAEELRPRYVACSEKTDPADYPAGTELIYGEDASERLAAVPCDVVVLAVSGFAALKPLLVAARNGGRIAIANKESLVCGGDLVIETIQKYGAELVPVDSEQCALFQCLMNGKKEEVQKLILTASGGPFFRKSREQLKNVSLHDVLQHPTWNMGRKITLDSATLFNKGLEIMEAARLFRRSADEIDVLIHPQSIVHSMVEYRDSSVIANLAVPDMRLPIQYALTYPDRIPSLTRALDLSAIRTLEFYPADPERFPAIRLAYEALRRESGYPVVYNAANEIAADSFFNGRIQFLDIESCVEETLSAYSPILQKDIDSVFMTDVWARRFASDFCKTIR